MNCGFTASIFSHSPEAQLICDPQRRILAVNLAFTQLTGYTIEDVRGKNPGMLSSGQNPPDLYQAMWSDLVQTDHWQGEIIDQRKDGSTYPKWLAISVVRDPQGHLTHYVGSLPISPSVKKPLTTLLTLPTTIP